MVVETTQLVERVKGPMRFAMKQVVHVLTAAATMSALSLVKNSVWRLMVRQISTENA